MKRVKALLLALVLVVSLFPVTASAETGSATASLAANSSTVQAGTDVTLLFSLSGTNLMGAEATLEYDEDVLEYRSYSNVYLLWDVVPVGTKFHMTGIEYPINGSRGVMALTFRVKSGTAAGTALNVALKDIVVSDGNSDSSVGTVTWSGSVAPVPATPTSVAYIEGKPDVQYTQLQTAVDDAVNGDVIKMLGDFMLVDELKIDIEFAQNGYYHTISKSITFDLCGHKFDIKGGSVAGEFSFENGTLTVSDASCDVGGIRTQSGVVNIKGGTIGGLPLDYSISGTASCSIWGGVFPNMTNDSIKPYLVSETPFYRIDVNAQPSIPDANWPIEVPPMFWLSAVVTGGTSVTTMDGCFVECKTGVVANLFPDHSASEYYDSRIMGVGANGLANGDNLAEISNSNGNVTFTMCPADTYFGVLSAGARVNVKYSAIKHDITMAPTEHGSFEVSSSRASAEEIITLTTTPDEGYEVNNITVTKTTDSTDITDSIYLAGSSNTYTFVMPNEPVTISVTFAAIPTYAITKSSSTNGNFTVPANATANETITLTTTPNSGYEVNSITITKTADGTDITASVYLAGSPNTYTFTMPEEAITVSVTFKQTAESSSRPIVNTGGWYPTTPAVSVSVDSSSLRNAAQAVGAAIVSGNAEIEPIAGYTEKDVIKLQKEGKLNLEVEKEPSYDFAEKQLIDAVIKKAGGAVSGTSVMYFEFTPLLKTDSGTSVAVVTDTEKPLIITIDLSDDLQRAAKDGKKICVIRAHDGKVSFVDGSLNTAKTKITVSSSLFSTYLGRYQDLRDDWTRRRNNGELTNIEDDIVFETELVRQIEINIDYILMLVKAYHDSNCKDKEVLVSINRAIDASPELRSKKDLIEWFIARVTNTSNMMTEWKEFVSEQKEAELERIIAEENLKPEETRKFIELSLQAGEIKTSGTDIDKLMPAVSRFGGGNRAEKKNNIITRLKAFFDRFFGLG